MYSIYQRHQARKRKSRGIWYIRWDHRGRTGKESLHTPDKDRAKERAAVRWTKITASKGNSKRAADYTFREAVADYGGESRFVDVLAVALDETPLSQVDGALLRKIGKGLYPGTHTRTII